MARSEARLVVSIWADPDFLALSGMAQRMFMFLISQPDLAHDGVIALRERRWSKAAAGISAAQVSADLEELSTARFIVVDEDAEELLIRSFIRRDKVYRQPNVLRAAADHLATVSSFVIRREVAAELARIQDADDIPEGSKGVLDAMLDGLPMPSGNPSANPSGDPPEGHLKRQAPIPGIGDAGALSTGLAAAVRGDSAPDSADHPEVGVSAGEKGSPKGSAKGSPKGNGLRPGERGVVTAVSSASPNPVPRPPFPVPRAAASPRPREDARKRGTRLPDDFEVTAEMVIWARERVPKVDGRHETEKFINHWRGKSGRDATKLDWVATWKNWMLRASEGTSTPRLTGANRHTSQRHDNPFAEKP